MKNSIKEELTQHIHDAIAEGRLTPENFDDWHFICFNEDHYLIYYSACDKWLKEHNIGQLEGMRICTDYEKDMFGESDASKYDNTESIVNMLAYIYGEELISEIGEEIREQMQRADEIVEDANEMYEELEEIETNIQYTPEPTNRAKEVNITIAEWIEEVQKQKEKIAELEKALKLAQLA